MDIQAQHLVEQMARPLQGKVSLVTGSTSGIGLGIARALAAAGSAIVLNGSINAHIGMPNTSVYAASKAALISLAKTLSSELLISGVRVNVVSAGPVKTHLLDRMGLPAEQLSEVEAGIQAQIPLKRFGTPEEIASAVLYLASIESAYIVGTELVADGGMSQL